MTESEKRKFHPLEFKAKVGLEALGGMKSINRIAQKYGVHPDAGRAREARDPSSGQEEVVALQKEIGLVTMGGHTRRFNSSHQHVHRQITAGRFNIQQLDVQTYFFRRTNSNVLRPARSWTDHLLWYHAAHTADLFAFQARSPIVQAKAIQRPIHPGLNIAMDMSI